jgi:ABC-type glycerol-3-phosphate transport system substrate-binding protein
MFRKLAALGLIATLGLAACSNTSVYFQFFPYPPGLKSSGPGAYGPDLKLLAKVSELRTGSAWPWGEVDRRIVIRLSDAAGLVIKTVELKFEANENVTFEGEWVSAVEFQVVFKSGPTRAASGDNHILGKYVVYLQE